MAGEDTHVTGTLVWYYYICRRQVWLISHNITPDENEDNVVLGRYIHEESYNRERKELLFHGGKADIIGTKSGQLVVAEVKKSSKAKESARMQLAFYLYELSTLGIEARGELRFPEERRRESVILDDRLRGEVERAKGEILKLIYEPYAPEPEKIHWCKNCAYQEFCWS
ncbi:MAG TPA: CRISPR-associated protein Cas4 [Firmicutes bacterium]|nr:CRISPR-associated protein Cas4 [Bacillota bacterium]